MPFGLSETATKALQAEGISAENAQLLLGKITAVVDGVGTDVDSNANVLKILCGEVFAAKGLESPATAAQRPAIEVAKLKDELKQNSKQQQNFMESFAKAGLSPQLAVDIAASSVACIAPLAAEDRAIDDQIADLSNSIAMFKRLQKVGKFVNKQVCTRAEWRHKDLLARKGKMKLRINHAMERHQATTVSTSKLIAQRLANDRNEYRNAIESMSREEPGVLEKLTRAAEAFVNVTPLKIGDMVLANFERKLTKAKVVAVPSDPSGKHTVALWLVCTTDGCAYYESFEGTTFGARTTHVELSRSKLYHNVKDRQKLSETALKDADARSKIHTDVVYPPVSSTADYMMLLIDDATRSLPRLRALGELLRSPSVTPKYAPLKKTSRACVKVLEKYFGDFSQLTDMARMTFECTLLSAAHEVLEGLGQSSEFKLLRIKNRLMPEFDADPTGGYRDLLVNAVCNATGHICEIQITLVPLLAIKSSGGHFSYSLARSLHLFEKDVTAHDGCLSNNVISRIDSGVMREFCGQSLGCQITPLFDPLVAAVGSSCCSLAVLKLSSVDWPKGRKLGELITPLARSVGAQLRHVELTDTNTELSELPADFFKLATGLEYFEVSGCNIGGMVPEAVSCCKNLQSFFAGQENYGLKGVFPLEAFATLPKLKELAFEQTGCTFTDQGLKAIIGALKRIPGWQFWHATQKGRGFVFLDESRS